MIKEFFPVAAIRKAIERAKSKGMTHRNARPSLLVLIAPFVDGDPTMEFSVLDEVIKKNHALAIGLERRDEFFAKAADAFILRTPMGLNKANEPYEMQGNSKIYSAPYPSVFPAAQALDLEQFYNAKMKLQTDEKVRQEDLWMQIFRKAAHTQPTAQTIASTELGAIDLGRSVRFVGEDKSTIEVKMPKVGTYQNMEGDTDYKNYACLVFYGALVKNGSKAKID